MNQQWKATMLALDWTNQRQNKLNRRLVKRDATKDSSIRIWIWKTKSIVRSKDLVPWKVNWRSFKERKVTLTRPLKTKIGIPWYFMRWKFKIWCSNQASLREEWSAFRIDSWKRSWNSKTYLVETTWISTKAWSWEET